MTLYSSAYLKPLARLQASRVRALVSELKENQCLVKFNGETLELVFDDSAMRWICIGQLDRIFKHYKDVVNWPGEFSQDDSQKDRRKIKRNHLLPPPGLP